jgi:peptidyl-prolyl cis-trans isomerase SurA
VSSATGQKTDHVTALAAVLEREADMEVAALIRKRRTMKSACSRAVIAAACLIAACAAAPCPAAAQQVVLIVNGDIITDYDIDQRMKFMALSNHKQPSRIEVIEDLIDEKLKVQVSRRYKVEISEKDVDQNYAEMGKRLHLTSEQLTQAFAQSGVDSATLKARIRADTAWQYLIRGKFQSSLQISEKSVLAEIKARRPDDAAPTVGYDYTLRPILFVVQHGDSALFEQRRRDAELLRARFNSCDNGLAVARGLRDVAVREPITKNSSELLPALRDILDKTEIGHLTAPETTAQGVELFALCEKKETRNDTPEKAEVRNKIFSETFQTKANNLLRDLRRQAMIERK